MKVSFWDILSTILIAAGLVMASVFIILYKNPDSTINPFPPPTLAEVSLLPGMTATSVSLPEIWTPVPETEESAPPSDQENERWMKETQTAAITNTPVLNVPTKSGKIYWKSPTPEQYAAGISLPTKNPLEPTGETDVENQMLTITAPIGVFDNTWQNIQSIPSFSWSAKKTLQEIDHYLLYFGTKQNGRLAGETVKMHYSHPAVPSGIYYFRVIAIAEDGMVIGPVSNFLFKYDDTPPLDPENFDTANNGETELPYFTWTDSADAHSGLIGGLAGYSIYQGTYNKCGKAVAFTTVPHWSPVKPLTKGTTEYFCVQAMDAVGNKSEWVGPLAYTYEN